MNCSIPIESAKKKLYLVEKHLDIYFEMDQGYEDYEIQNQKQYILNCIEQNKILD